MSAADVSVVFSRLVCQQSDLKGLCSNVTVDKQLYMYNMCALEAFCFVKCGTNIKYELVCQPLQWLFLRLGIFHMASEIPELQLGITFVLTWTTLGIQHNAERKLLRPKRLKRVQRAALFCGRKTVLCL